MTTATGVNWCVKLKEYADVNKFTVQYYKMSASGPSHDPTFNVKVKILCDNKLKAKGTGKTKKGARCQAAHGLMALINQVDKNPNSEIPTSESETQSGDENCSENFIGDLQVSDNFLSYDIYNV